jgi:hypothetical protein
MMATEDHLVPDSKGGKGRELSNLVLSCRVCNGLKANFVPEPPIDAIADRRNYIVAVRAHIMKRRSDRLKEFFLRTDPDGQPGHLRDRSSVIDKKGGQVYG